MGQSGKGPESVRIDTSAVTSCSVLPGGDRIALNLVDAQGRPLELTVSSEDARAIAMALPGTITKAIRAKSRDDSKRCVFPLDQWQMEAASDRAHVIVTLAATDGTEVSFLAKPDMCRSLGSSLQRILSQMLRLAAPVLSRP